MARVVASAPGACGPAHMPRSCKRLTSASTTNEISLVPPRAAGRGACRCACAARRRRRRSTIAQIRTPRHPWTPFPRILDAFRTHQLVGFPGGHTDGNETMELLRSLMRDPRFPAMVNDIVVEFGSSRYQDLMDRYVRGEEVPDAAFARSGRTPCRPARRSTIPTPRRSFARSAK